MQYTLKVFRNELAIKFYVLNNNIRKARGEEIKGNKAYKYPHFIQGEVNIISILMLIIRGIHIQVG